MRKLFKVQNGVTIWTSGNPRWRNAFPKCQKSGWKMALPLIFSSRPPTIKSDHAKNERGFCYSQLWILEQYGYHSSLILINAQYYVTRVDCSILRYPVFFSLPPKGEVQLLPLNAPLSPPPPLNKRRLPFRAGKGAWWKEGIKTLFAPQGNTFYTA